MERTRRVVVVGVGALGSHAVLFLRNAEAAITVVDDDRVEVKNLASQFHGRSGVGKPKVLALKQAMDFFFGLKIEAVPHRLTADNAEVLLGGADIVIDCLDNGASRRLVQAAVRHLSVPCLHGALAADGAYGQVVWDEHFIVDDEPSEGALTCAGGEHLAFIALAAAYLAEAAQAYLREGRKCGFSLHSAGALKI